MFDSLAVILVLAGIYGLGLHNKKKEIYEPKESKNETNEGANARNKKNDLGTKRTTSHPKLLYKMKYLKKT